MKALLLLTIMLLSGCFLIPEAEPEISFADVSEPVRDEYGAPEEVVKYISDDYMITDWWYWTQGVCITFANTPYDGVNGWCIDSEYYFAPIY